MARKLLKKAEQGKIKCVKVRGDDLCVVSDQHTFQATLHRPLTKGGRIPVAIRNARTMKTAIKRARASVKKLRLPRWL